MASKGNANRISLGDRMKAYENVHTQTSLVPGVPVYVRIDGRAFHTFTRGLDKPFDEDFAAAMKETAKYLHAKTGAFISYVQSDEISLCYASPSKMPFETRLFKLESCLAGMASAAFCVYGSETKMRDRIRKFVPHIDCRVCQMPLEDIPNMLLFREKDCVKNAVTLVALEHFSDRQIHGKNTDEKIGMLKAAGVDFFGDVEEGFRNGFWFRRVELARIPEKMRKPGPDGKVTATRSEIRQVKFGMTLSKMENRDDVVLNGADPVRKTGSAQQKTPASAGVS